MINSTPGARTGCCGHCRSWCDVLHHRRCAGHTASPTARAHVANTARSNCHIMPPVLLTTPSDIAAKIDDQVQARSQSQNFAITANSNCQLSATSQLDDTSLIAQQPPNT